MWVRLPPLTLLTVCGGTEDTKDLESFAHKRAGATPVIPTMKSKYTKELLEPLVKESKSIAEVLRKLNLKYSGGNHSNIGKIIKQYEIDTSHFTGQAWNVGVRDKKYKYSNDILCISTKLYRVNVRLLKRALLEIGREYKCELCGLKDKWNNKPIVLEIDHINRNWQDNRAENLRFLCPNCHSQE